MSDVELLAEQFAVLVRGLRELHGAIVARCEPPVEAAAAVLLGRVEQLAPVRLTDVACSMGLDASTVSRQVSALVSRGWVVRDPDPQDLRAHVLSLTDDGRTTVASLRATRTEVLTRLLPDWTAEQLRSLTTALARLNHDLTTGSDRLELVGTTRHGKA